LHYWYNPAAVNATIAQSVEQTFRKRQVKSSNLFGGSQKNDPDPKKSRLFSIESGHFIAEMSIPSQSLMGMSRDKLKGANRLVRPFQFI
jgi:hypothetical protein